MTEQLPNQVTNGGLNPTSPLQTMRDRYKVVGVTYDQCRDWLMNKHYARRMPSITFSYGLYDTNNVLQGVCTFGQPPSDGIQMCCGEKYKKNTIELNRLIKNDQLDTNLQSWFASQCLRFLPRPMIVISYADPDYGHMGYTYQALNFLYTGKGRENKEYVFQGHRYHSRHIIDYWFESFNLPFSKTKTIDANFTDAGGIVKKVGQKHRYVYFLGNKQQIKEMRSLLVWEVLPYPKGNNQRYDASYQPYTQGLLI